MKNYMRKMTKKQWLVSIGLLVLVVLFLSYKDEVLQILERDGDIIRRFLHNHVGFALLITFVVMFIQNTFTLYPVILVITINNLLLGYVNGLLWSWISSVLSSIIAFYGVRYVFQDKVGKNFSTTLIEKVDAHGFAYVFQARIFPLAPTSVVNIVAGLSTIQVLPFLLATTIGNFLFILVFTLIQAGFLSAELNITVIWGMIFAVTLLFYFMKRVRKNKKSAP